MNSKKNRGQNGGTKSLLPRHRSRRLLLLTTVIVAFFSTASDSCDTEFAYAGFLPTFQSDGPSEPQEQTDADAKPLSVQWRDYLLSEISDKQRANVKSELSKTEQQELTNVLEKTDFKLDAIAAQVYLTRLCEMGPRVSGTQAMSVQQQALENYFSQLDAEVVKQRWSIAHPETRKNVELTNMIVQLHPTKRRRILICCHYDTRPYADQDPTNPRAPLIGANDGASGVGLLMVLAPHLKKLDGRTGIDLVFFDAEELVYQRPRDPLFIGSTYFARQYVSSRPNFRYVGGVLIDMVGDKTLELYYEKNSLQQAGPITKSVWNVARRLRIKEFVARPLHEVRDDHLPLNNIAKIPTTDLIDFDYPSINSQENYWHTTDDLPDKCSPVSLAKVGVVLLEWAKEYTR